MMGTLAVFRDLCRLRAGPQDLPYAPRALALGTAALIAATIVIGLLVPTPDAGAQPVLAVLGTLFSLAALYGLLRVQDKANRFVQTALAWTGVKLLFVLLMLPLAPMLPTPGHLPVAGDPVTPQQALQALLGLPLLALFVWMFAVLTHVLRQALELKTAGALGLVIALFLVPELAASVLVAAFAGGAAAGPAP